MNKQDDVKQLLSMVEEYRRSVVNADNPEIAARVWLDSPDATFIHPRGHERGWTQILDNFYRKTMDGAFSRRDLKVTGEPEMRVYGDTALVEFYWEFEAVSRADGSLRNTSGRESQMYLKKPGAGWKLAHVHYSGQPQS